MPLVPVWARDRGRDPRVRGRDRMHQATGRDRAESPGRRVSARAVAFGSPQRARDVAWTRSSPGGELMASNGKVKQASNGNGNHSAADRLFWSKRGHVACRDHAPDMHSERWQIRRLVFDSRIARAGSTVSRISVLVALPTADRIVTSARWSGTRNRPDSSSVPTRRRYRGLCSSPRRSLHRCVAAR